MWLSVFSVLSICLASAQIEAFRCDSTSCKIPDCRCADTNIPGGFAATQVPQIVLLTFDDAVSALLYSKFYEPLLDLKNPNGCGIGLTFFASHEYCDYSLVHSLWRRGHEIADHSISHKADQNYWNDKDSAMWHDEFVGMREILSTFAKIPKKDIKGIRVPFLKVGGNAQFKMMEEQGFTWDCSISIRDRKPGTWPFSLKYSSGLSCQVGVCPTDSFPNEWVIPMLNLFNSDNYPCAMLDTCIVYNETDAYNVLMDNFLVQYNGNRAPFGLYTHAAWFLQEEFHFAAYERFIREINKKKDVYIVTVSQALDYARYPVELSRITSYVPWLTQCATKPDSCADTKNCRCTKQESWGESERYMKICGNRCPDSYPWVGNPSGQSDKKTCG